eukprot:gene26619-34869_t
MIRLLTPMLLLLAAQYCISAKGTQQEGAEKGHLKSLLIKITGGDDQTVGTPIRLHSVKKEISVATQAVTPICLYGDCTPSKGNVPCIAGTTCIFKDQYYSQCLLNSTQDATSQCARNYRVCSTGSPSCCSKAFTCLKRKCEAVAPPQCVHQNYYSASSSFVPSTVPTALPLSSKGPSTVPTAGPTVWPSATPTSAPTFRPTTSAAPTAAPSSVLPSTRPTNWPTKSPSVVPTASTT